MPSESIQIFYVQGNRVEAVSVLEPTPVSPQRKMFDLAERIGMSASPCWRRQKELEDNGTILRYQASIMYRAQPWGNFSVNVQNANLEFPGSYGKTSLFLIQPRIEINFSNRLFWTTFIQFNNQNNNLNFNSRLQWRYKPMSDLYLVYTDNYYTDPLFKNKNRAIVFKMNYWLNL